MNGRENLRKVERPFIIVVNHFSFADSFLFRLILGFATPHLPLRFMAVKKFDWPWLDFLSKIGVVGFIYSIFGVFIVTPGLGLQKNLEEAKRLIGRKQNIVIYPEGKIVTERAIAPFKPGAAVLASDTGAPIIPIASHLGRTGFFRKELIVNIGRPVWILSNAVPAEATDLLYRTITDLYNKK